MFKTELEEALYNIEQLQSVIDESVDIIELLCSPGDDELHYHIHVTAAKFVNRVKPKKPDIEIPKSTHCLVCRSLLDPVNGCVSIDCIPF